MFDPRGFFMDCTRRYGDLVEIRFPPFRNFLVTQPRDVEYVLQTNHRNYWKGMVLGRLKLISGSPQRRNSQRYAVTGALGEATGRSFVAFRGRAHFCREPTAPPSRSQRIG